MKKILMILIVVMLAGCGIDLSLIGTIPEEVATPGAVLQTQPPTPVSAPVNGGTLKMSMRFPKTLNPLKNEDSTVDNVLKLIFEPLFVFDETQKVIPNLASGYSVSADGVSISITLRDDLVWHDGKEIVADDVIFSLDTIKSASELSIYKNVMANIRNYKSSGRKTVTITYNQPNGYGMYYLCFPIIPKHYYNKNASADMAPLGSGVFSFEDFNTVGMTLKKSENYFKKTAYIDNIYVLILHDREADYYSFEQSITDVLTTSISEWGKHRGEKRTDMADFVTSYYDFIGFNFKRQPLNNINIRKAVAHCLPAERVVETVYLNHAVRTLSPVNPTSWLYSGENIPLYDFSIDTARKFILDSGYTKEELSFDIIVNEENEERVKIATMLAENLNEAGMNVKIKALAFNEYEDKLKASDFDMFAAGIRLSDVPDLSPLFYSEKSIGSINYFNYSNTDMDLLLNGAAMSVDEFSFKRSLFEIQKFAANDLPCVSVAFRKSILLTDYKVRGEKKVTSLNLFYNINDWYISEM